MSLRQKYLHILSAFAPVGAVGVSLVLGSAMPAAASTEPAGTQPTVQPSRVSERLAAIRDAVSAVASEQSTVAAPEQRLAWGNFVFRPYFGYGWPNWGNGWNNWGNWRNGWGNW